MGGGAPGILAGGSTDKVDPYLKPLYDALRDMMDPERVARLMEKEVIEVAPLAFMRGRTLNDAFIILDEAQNTTREQMKMFLTRIGYDSKAVITGDVTQVDLPSKSRSGLIHALHILGDVPGIARVRFQPGDVVRHPLVRRIIQAYEQDDAEMAARRKPGKRTDKGKEAPSLDRSSGCVSERLGTGAPAQGVAVGKPTVPNEFPKSFRARLGVILNRPTIIGGMISQNLLNLIDVAMVGRLENAGLLWVLRVSVESPVGCSVPSSWGRDRQFGNHGSRNGGREGLARGSDRIIGSRHLHRRSLRAHFIGIHRRNSVDCLHGQPGGGSRDSLSGSPISGDSVCDRKLLLSRVLEWSG